MSPASPSTPSHDAKEKLTQNVRDICLRVEQGKAVAWNWWVRLQLALALASILLSTLGSAGVILDKAAGNLPEQTGWAFWGSVILLGFGIVTQFANQFQVAKRAADSESLAERCRLVEARLPRILRQEDPQAPVATLLDEVDTLFESERYNKVTPKLTDEMKADALKKADELIARYQGGWQLKGRKPQGGVR